MRNTLPLSSFPLQILLVFQQYYQLVLSIFIFFLVLFKTYNLPYTAAMSAQQGIILFIFIIYMQIRIKYGISANRTESSTKMALFVIMTAIGIVFGIYYVLLQYYVLQVQVIVFAILIVLEGLELILAFFACWQFQSYQKQQ